MQDHLSNKSMCFLAHQSTSHCKAGRAYVEILAMTRPGMVRDASGQDRSTCIRKKTRDLNHQGSRKTISDWTLHLVYIKTLFSDRGFIDI